MSADLTTSGDVAAVAPAAPRRGLLSHLPRAQFLRYLCVGVFNTGFGYGMFSLLNHLFHRANIPWSYMYAAVLSNVISITVAYFGYKFFVFRTRGNYLREWLKAMGVYGVAQVPGLVLLTPLVHLIAWLLPPQMQAMHHSVSGKDASPYIASAIITGFTVISSFIGHKKVTFRESKA